MFKQFRVFSLGQVLLPLNATRIAYFVLVLALALALAVTHSLVVCVVVVVALLMAIDIYGFASI